MADNPLQAVADYVFADDDDPLAKAQAEAAYNLMAFERELAINTELQDEILRLRARIAELESTLNDR